MKNFLALLVICLSQSLVFASNWKSGLSDDKDNYYAFTLNDSDSLLGQYCYIGDEQCFWLVATATKCETNVSTPILISHDKGANHARMICRGSLSTNEGENYYRYVIDDFKLIDQAIRSTKIIGVAMPLKSGEFRAMRFDLDGVIPAIDGMRSKAQAVIDKKLKKRTKDKFL